MDIFNENNKITSFENIRAYQIKITGAFVILFGFCCISFAYDFKHAYVFILLRDAIQPRFRDLSTMVSLMELYKKTK